MGASESISGMLLLRFLNAVRKHWWPLMSCAVFTLLGMWVLYANKNNDWALRVTFSAAIFCLFWACFLAWRDKEKEFEELKSKLLKAEKSTSRQPIQNIYLPAPRVPAKPEPPKHNVQCLGVEADGGFVTICFQNMPIPGQPLGDFNNARLCVEFKDGLTGVDCATVFPARWIDDGHGNNSVSITPRRAFLACFYEHDVCKWRALPALEGPSDLSQRERIDGLWLPSTWLQVKVTLVGENNITLAPICGFLTLREDGQASWEPRGPKV
jgi:hypothetical protein